LLRRVEIAHRSLLTNLYSLQYNGNGLCSDRHWHVAGDRDPRTGVYASIQSRPGLDSCCLLFKGLRGAESSGRVKARGTPVPGELICRARRRLYTPQMPTIPSRDDPREYPVMGSALVVLMYTSQSRKLIVLVPGCDVLQTPSYYSPDK
jgi:hypothetical protein